MKLIKLYSWLAGSLSDFTKPFQDNEALYKQARAFWNRLDNNSIVIFLIMIVLGISFASYYYKPYNDKPGRHYTLGHWAIFLVVTLAMTFVVTWGFEHFAVPPKITGAMWLEIKIAFCNALYAVGVYFIMSVVWCTLDLPTNACKIFKLR